MKNMLGVYIHVPFCIKKCNYCDFHSYVANNYEEYVKALILEIDAFEKCDVDTIFVGGGTPTLVPLDGILNALSRKFNIVKGAEISVETNPKIFGDFKSLRAMGFNRLSMGLQSVHDDELRVLGRAYNFEEFKTAYISARREFENINLDIMYSLPDQTMDKWVETVETVRGLAPEHISCYALKIEEGTPFASMQLNLPDDELDRQMYWYMENLSEYRRYEISNFAKPGFECRHNLKYWRREEYIGFGEGAHSFLNQKRWCGDEIEEISEIDAVREGIFLGLRLSEGIDERKLKGRFAKELEESIREGLLQRNGDILTLTNRGIDLSNQVFMRLF